MNEFTKQTVKFRTELLQRVRHHKVNRQKEKTDISFWEVVNELLEEGLQIREEITTPEEEEERRKECLIP